MADSNNKKANKLQTVKKIETAEEKSASKPVRCPKYEKDLEKGKPISVRFRLNTGTPGHMHTQ